LGEREPSSLLALVNHGRPVLATGRPCRSSGGHQVVMPYLGPYQARLSAIGK
jgi:hypothetical protein